jgi:hypothetical protein
VVVVLTGMFVKLLLEDVAINVPPQLPVNNCQLVLFPKFPPSIVILTDPIPQSVSSLNRIAFIELVH